MKRKFIFTISSLTCFTVAFAMVVGIDGNWTGQGKLPNGEDLTLNYTFKTDNDKFTGSAQGSEILYKILDGKIYGDSLSFNVVVENGNIILNRGKYYADGDSICLSFFLMGTNIMHLTLKRDLGSK